ncbi:MAG: type II toxin-antitoxin system MqsA family antitoxin [Caldilineaceae bacterium]|nr:type II toxin-antitoxin system MqsA family antitoxin [Caldilineaceae bacterium]MBP8106092.1 type II toxin-antitoxin system MqsA family antitoxin [Caldilineaceae bacterium]MBP9074698.1 type II toxin-antitoxin system MqsA family antitoxin [Caldilineaceae bacterium]
MTYQNDTTLTCDLCEQSGAILRMVSRSYGQGDDLHVIENVPVIGCPHCGESYLTADTLIEIERIKSQDQTTPTNTLDSVEWHRRWQAGLDREQFFDEVFGPDSSDESQD